MIAKQNIPSFVGLEGRRCTVPEYGTNPEKNIAIFCFIKNDAKSKNKLNKAMKAS